MTTSHRPQLEARNGAKNIEYVPTSTQHARLLPGHKEVKYRNVNKRTVVQKSGSEGPRKKCKNLEIDVEPGLDADELQDTDSSDEYEEEEDEDSENEEALLEEWNKVRQERLNSKLQEQQKKRSQLEQTEAKKMQTPSGWRSDTVFGRKKVAQDSWKPSGENRQRNSYINDMSRSDYHQNFIRKHVR